MKKILLYGELAKRFGKEHRFAVKNAAEALRALKANFPGFEAYMCGAHHQGVGFRMFVGRHELKNCDEVHTPAGAAGTIELVPVITGSKDAWVGILLGVALIGAAVALGPAGFGILGSTLAMPIGVFGASMALGGVVQLLSPPPKGPQELSQAERKQSYIFNGPTNNSAQGRAIPLIYGRMIVGSEIVSSGIETHEADD